MVAISVFLYFVHIFNQIELGLERLNDSPSGNTRDLTLSRSRIAVDGIGDKPGADGGFIGLGGGCVGQAESSIAEATADRAPCRTQYGRKKYRARAEDRRQGYRRGHPGCCRPDARD